MGDIGDAASRNATVPHESYYAYMVDGIQVSDLVLHSDISREPLVWDDGTWGPIRDDVDFDWESPNLLEVPESFVAFFEGALDEGLGLERHDVIDFVSTHYLRGILEAFDQAWAAGSEFVESALHPSPPAGTHISHLRLLESITSAKTHKHGPLRALERVLRASEVHPQLSVSVDALSSLMCGAESLRQRTRALQHHNPMVRSLATLLSSDVNDLRRMAMDPCVLVRHAGALNSRSPREALELLAFDRFLPVVDALAELRTKEGEDLGEGSSDLTYWSPEICSCTPRTKAHSLFDEWSAAGLTVPTGLPEHLLGRLRAFHEWHTATQPFPLPFEDYLLDTADYLRNPVPDQLALNHAGHGINSYALNLRLAVGPLALVVQVAWGGVYGSIGAETESWNDLMERVSRLLAVLDVQEQPSSGYRQRRYLLTYSDFRDVPIDDDLWRSLRFEIYESGAWHVEPSINAWESAERFIAAHV